MPIKTNEYDQVIFDYRKYLEDEKAGKYPGVPVSIYCKCGELLEAEFSPLSIVAEMECLSCHTVHSVNVYAYVK